MQGGHRTLVRRFAATVAIASIASLTSCAIALPDFESLSRAQAQGEWIATADGHTVSLDLASVGTVTVAGIPESALETYDSADDAPVHLDWSRLANLSGTWSFFEPYAGNPASIQSSLSNAATHEQVSSGLALDGTSIVFYYGNIEDNTGLTFKKSAHQSAQTHVQLVSRRAFLGTWVGTTPGHKVTAKFNGDGSVAFSDLPLDLLRSDGSAQITWSSTRSFSASWIWSEDPITPNSALSISLNPRPSGSEFDVTRMDVLVSGSMISLRMRSGLVSWDRHIDFLRSS